jgi:hypothetical protein
MKQRQARERKKVLFLLHEMLPMRPYLFSLMSDLRAVRIRQQRQRRLATPPRYIEQSYEERRKRHEAIAELARLQKEESDLFAEFEKLGVRVGDVIRGEMLFSCSIDHRDAYFIWYDSEPKPTCWRFRGNPETHEIRDDWFSPTAVLPRGRRAKKEFGGSSDREGGITAR